MATEESAFPPEEFYRDPPLAAWCAATKACLRPLFGCAAAAFVCGIDAATRLCSSGVSWKI